MQDCPGRATDHPSLTPAFHHVTRRCGGCGRTGCVVPRCRHQRFVPAAPEATWTAVPAAGEAHREWTCRTCGAARSAWA